MDKSILYEYIDACALVKEMEEDIKNLKKQQTVYDKVKGSNPEFPYQSQSFHLSGIVETLMDGEELDDELKRLEELKDDAIKKRKMAIEVLKGAPARMQRIIRYKVFKGLTWEQTAIKIGGKCTGESVRQEFRRFIKEI